MIKSDDLKIAIIGLGYVGLPLAVEFGKNRSVIGFDTNPGRIRDLAHGIDTTLEVSKEELRRASFVRFSSQIEDIRDCDCYIVTVPTPVNEAKYPDVRHLEEASRTVGEALQPNDLVIYESTVYPGATEEVCVPILEQASGLKFNSDFFRWLCSRASKSCDKSYRVRHC